MGEGDNGKGQERKGLKVKNYSGIKKNRVDTETSKFTNVEIDETEHRMTRQRNQEGKKR